MAKNSAQKLEWILLIHQLPPKPTNLRVRIWRKLQKLGAVAIKNSVYVLPANEKTHEDFQWLKQEIESADGEATVFQAASVEGATDEEIMSAFRKARDEEFAAIAAELDGLSAVSQQTRGKHLSVGRLATNESELDKLHSQLESIIANDFFNADKRTPALAAYERCQEAIRAAHGQPAKASGSRRRSGTLDLAKYQGRRWMTRRNLHVDRVASAWLIKQFIDKRPRFYFVAEGETVEGAIAFDMYGAEFTHHGEDCSFETLLKRFGLSGTKSLRAIAEIVHDIDLKDDKVYRLEAAGGKTNSRSFGKTLRSERQNLSPFCALFI